jgi:hypothetical protein
LFHKNLIFPVGCSAFIKLHYFNAVFPTHQILSPSALLALSPSNIIDNLGWCSRLTRPTLKIHGWKKSKSPLQDRPRLLQPQRCCELICSRGS